MMVSWSADNLDQYELLILPNVAALSNHQCDQLRAYIEHGGEPDRNE